MHGQYILTVAGVPLPTVTFLAAATGGVGFGTEEGFKGPAELTASEAFWASGGGEGIILVGFDTAGGLVCADADDACCRRGSDTADGLLLELEPGATWGSVPPTSALGTVGGESLDDPPREPLEGLTPPGALLEAAGGRLRGESRAGCESSSPSAR